MRGVMLGYSFEPRLATAGSIMTIGFINKRMLAIQKTSLTRDIVVPRARLFLVTW